MDCIGQPAVISVPHKKRFISPIRILLEKSEEINAGEIADFVAFQQISILVGEGVKGEVMQGPVGDNDQSFVLLQQICYWRE